MAIHWAIEKFDNLASTQSFIKSDRPNASEGTLILAKQQSAGYGRHGRTWEEGADNLYFSFILEPHCPIDQLGQISLLTSLAIYQALENYLTKTDHELLKIKWPNDLILDGKKCSGLIIETLQRNEQSIAKLVIGIGINVNTSPLPYSTCLQTHIKSALKEDNVLATFLDKLDTLYDEWKVAGFHDLKVKWEKASFEHGAKISVKQGNELISGHYLGIDHSGALLLECDDTKTKRTIYAGDIFLQPKSA